MLQLWIFGSPPARVRCSRITRNKSNPWRCSTVLWLVTFTYTSLVLLASVWGFPFPGLARPISIQCNNHTSLGPPNFMNVLTSATSPRIMTTWPPRCCFSVYRMEVLHIRELIQMFLLGSVTSTLRAITSTLSPRTFPSKICGRGLSP